MSEPPPEPQDAPDVRSARFSRRPLQPLDFGPAQDLAADEERVRRRLSDLAGFIAEARHLVGVGREAYLADSMSGAMLRNAGHYLLIKVATVVEKLPQSFKDGHPDVDWVGITRLRNLVAHHHDKIIDQTVWVAIESRLPELADKLDLR